MQGRRKKYYPERSGGVEIFLATLVIPLQGAKRLLRQRGSEHRFPAYTLTIEKGHGVEAGTFNPLL